MTLDEFASLLRSLAGSPFLPDGGAALSWALGLLALGLLLCLRRRRAAGPEAEDAARFDAILAAQSEMTGRLQAMAEHFGARQADLSRSLSERIEGLTRGVGQSMRESAGATGASLSALAERLAVIDRAQGQISDLAGEMVRLGDILSDKQARGAFGEGRMRAIVADALPSSAYSFGATLPNGRKPDCLVSMGRDAPPLAIDAKFPLEGFLAFREAETPEARAFAEKRVRRDMEVHVRAISEKYLISGETQEVALLFVPSESLFADLHEHFPETLERAQRLRVLVVSPTLLVLAIQIVRAILKDARMREEAGRIQREVALLADDLARLGTRVSALQTHFGQAARDVEAILVTADKLGRRGTRIAEIDLGEEPAPMRFSSPTRAPGDPCAAQPTGA